MTCTLIHHNHTDTEENTDMSVNVFHQQFTAESYPDIVARLEDEVSEAGSALLELEERREHYAATADDLRVTLAQSRNALADFKDEVRTLLIENRDESVDLDEWLSELGLSPFTRKVRVQGNVSFEIEVEVSGSMDESDFLSTYAYQDLDISLNVSTGYANEFLDAEVATEDVTISDVEDISSEF